MSTVSSSGALLLVHLRSVALATQAAAVLLAAGGLGMPLPLAIDGVLFGALAFMNALAWWYARRGAEPSAWVLTVQLAFDIAGLTAFLYFNGGYANPFASLFLLPLAVAATVLPMPHTAGLTALVVAGYSLVMFAYRPLPHYHGSLGDSFDLHLLGMWLSLVVAAVVIAAFVARLAAALRAREAHLAQLREAALRGEQLAALGALAAGTAHELSTPLSTMAVLAGELRAAAPVEQRADLELLSQQIERCREVLTRNLTVTGQGRAEGGGRLGLDTWLTALVEQWRQTRPQAVVRLSCAGTGEAPRLIVDETLRQALFSLLDNAADVSAEVDFAARWDAERVQFDIADRGPGVPHELAPRLGEPFVTSKPGGLGLGVYLARAVVERLGGRLAIVPRAGGGTMAQVSLPLAA